MKKSSKGFSAVELLIIIVVVGVLGAGGWLVWHRSKKNDTPVSKTQQSATQTTTYKRSTTVPANWKTYHNTASKFSFSYPSDWSVRSSETDGPVTVDIYPKGAANPQYIISTSDMTLAQAVADLKKNIQNDPSIDKGVTYTITKDQQLTYDGHPAQRIDFISDDGTSKTPGMQFFISANGKTYAFGWNAADKAPLKDKTGLTVFESLKLQ